MSAMSAMSAMVALSLLVSVSPVAAELEPLEDGCLLQKTNQRQLLVKEEQPAVPDYVTLCGPGTNPAVPQAGCRCNDFPLNAPVGTLPNSATDCAALCPFPTYEAFMFREDSGACRCCNETTHEPVTNTRNQFWVYLRTPVPDYAFHSGPNLAGGPGSTGRRCVGHTLADPGPTSPHTCGELCTAQSASGFMWRQNDVGNPDSEGACRCCPTGIFTPANSNFPFWLYESTAPPALPTEPPGAVGDPHITTLDGKRYTLLSQGTFSLWHFSGLETDLHSEEGLLLIDKTGGSIRQVLEITSQDCKWKARKGNEDWKVVDNAELISVPDGKEYLTGFDLSTVTGPRGHGGHGFPNRVHFNMNTKNGKLDIAVMSLSCRPSHNMNVQISMKRKSDQTFVDGELKVARKSLSMLQTSTDSEFSMDSKWQELGGSEQAASYFQLIDTHGTSIALLQSQGCGDAEKGRAKETCSKHLGEAHGIENTHFFEDCVYDVCHGAGETQAELAAELLAVTNAE
eukprot:s3690_g16.t1